MACRLASRGKRLHGELARSTSPRPRRDRPKTAVQVLGKVRARIEVAAGADQADVEAAARTAVAKWLEGKNVMKVIYVPGKLVNIVAK